MRAAELIDLLRQYDPDTDIPVAYTDADFGGQPGVQVASCYSTGDTRCVWLEVSGRLALGQPPR